MGLLVSLPGGFAPQAWVENGAGLFTATSLPLFTSALTALAVLLAITFIFTILAFRFDRAGMTNIPTMAIGPATTDHKMEDSSKDFIGDIKVDNNPPTKEQLEKVADHPVIDINKKSHTFKSLYGDNENGARRVMVIFIRHFFCGNCQEYLRTLSASIPPDTLSTLSPPTSIIVIGCGHPDLIPMYTRETFCPYPIYADPTRKLYDKLGMTKTLSLGSQTPDYMKRSIWSVGIQSVFQELRSGRYIFSGGDYRQVGGEFVFDGGKVVFCKRMKNTRDHTEIPEVRRVLMVDGEERPRARKRWSTAGLGAELGRRLSSRRRSWAPSRSRSRNTEAKGSPARSGMQEVKEEESVSATPEDALAKLEGERMANGTTTEPAPACFEKGESTEEVANGVVPNTSASGITNAAGTENKTIDGSTSSIPIGPFTEDAAAHNIMKDSEIPTTAATRPPSDRITT